MALQVIGAVAVIAVVAVAPGMGLVFKKLGVYRNLSTSYTPTLLGRLKKKGYIVFEDVNGRRCARLTALGRSRLREYQEELARKPQTQKKWDGKWRIVTFDIPEKLRKNRDQIRYELREAGFVLLHKSVWVTPYPCEEFVALLKADRHVGKSLLYIVAEHVEYGNHLQKIFNLPSSQTLHDRK